MDDQHTRKTESMSNGRVGSAEDTAAGEQELLPLNDPSIDWDDLSVLKSLTCRNHPTARYLTKNPWVRTLHIIRYPEGFQGRECPCPLKDLVVLVEREKE